MKLITIPYVRGFYCLYVFKLKATMEIFRKKCTSQKINKKSDNGNEILKKIKNRKRNIKFS